MTETTHEALVRQIATAEDLLAYFQGSRDSIEERVLFALDAISASIKYFWVDQLNGDDSNDGTVEAPLASFEKAFSRTPVGGVCYITLTNDYHMANIVTSVNLAVRIVGVDQPKITFDWYADSNNPGQVSRLASFLPDFRAEFHFSFLDIEFPADPVEPFTYTHMNGLIANTGYGLPAMVSAKFVGVNFYNPTGGVHCSIFAQADAFVSVRFSVCTFPAGFEGRVRKGIGGVGLDPDDYVRYISTNQSWI